MTNPLKLAFATDDVRQVNQAFGSARAFAVYAVDHEHAELVAAAECRPFEGVHEMQTRQAMIERLQECAAVYCAAISASAVRDLEASGILPIEVSSGSHIAELIHQFQNNLRRELRLA